MKSSVNSIATCSSRGPVSVRSTSSARGLLTASPLFMLLRKASKLVAAGAGRPTLRKSLKLFAVGGTNFLLPETCFTGCESETKKLLKSVLGWPLFRLAGSTTGKGTD